ncbi:MAG: hypothetical protein GX786_07505 [Clostridiales bacterium]|nr:hypothetical protein [Clostridiales bacterium]
MKTEEIKEINDEKERDPVTPQEKLKQELEQMKAELKASEEEVKKLKGKSVGKGKKTAKKEGKNVKIKLFYDGNQYKDPIYVSINGESLLIPRGIEVEIPEYFKEVVDRSIAQEQKTSAFYQRLEESTAANLNGTGQTLVDVKP